MYPNVCFKVSYQHSCPISKNISSIVGARNALDNIGVYFQPYSDISPVAFLTEQQIDMNTMRSTPYSSVNGEKSLFAPPANTILWILFWGLHVRPIYDI